MKSWYGDKRKTFKQTAGILSAKYDEAKFIEQYVLNISGY